MAIPGAGWRLDDNPDQLPRQRLFRDALRNFPTGITVVTARAGSRTRGMTVNGFMSVSLDPALILISIATQARMRPLLHEAGSYGVSVLAHDQEHISRHFAGQPGGGEIALTELADVPVVSNALTQMVAKVVDTRRAGDHTLFIGEVVRFARRSGEPLVFHSGAYTRLLSNLAWSYEWAGDLHAWRLGPASGKG